MSGLVDALRGTKADLVARSGRPDRLTQPGGCCLAEPFPVPLADPGSPAHPRTDEAVHETFVVDWPIGGPADGTPAAVAMGSDRALVEWWQPTVDALVERVIAEAGRWGIELDSPFYVSVSTTPLGQVIDEPHLDDDRFEPRAGVGLVAIAATHLGPRLAMGELPISPPTPGLPVERFDGDGGGGDDPVTWWQAPADRVVVLARFGQLHSGPAPGDLPAPPPDPDRIQARTLLVLRAGTVPTADQARVGSGPT